MQFFGGPQPPIAVFDSAFDRIDDFLALALLFGTEGKNDVRLSAVSVSRPDFATAQFVEFIRRFYSGMPNGTGFAAAFPVGLPEGKAAAPPAPLAAMLAQKGEDGASVFKPPIAHLYETGDPATVLRNALSASTPKGSIVVVSGPLTSVAQMLALRGMKETIALNVKHLAVAGGFAETSAKDRLARDAKAAQFVFAEWPTPIFLCGEDVGAAARYPGASIEKDFAYAKEHPVAEAYRAFGTMPYDAPTTGMDAALYAARPSNGFVQASEPGTLRMAAGGALEFTPGAGKHHRLTLNRDKAADLIAILTELASAKPTVRARRGPRAAADANGKAPVKKQ
jgi:inosine-uridine nucleoside N-ribohydrolase